jgi:hypothetical protein
MSESIPLIARIAGLPAESMEPFASHLVDEEVRRLLDAEADLANARAKLVDCLYAAIQGTPPERRRFLLAVKRDVFNGRSLAWHRSDPRWNELAKAAGLLAECVVELEEQVKVAAAAFEAAHQEQQYRERRAFALFLADTQFLRGVALGSQVLVENLGRLTQTPPESYGRRERRLGSSLLRYASRSALKLSPFSSLTRVGLGLALSEGPDTLGFRFVGQSAWSERSLVCFRRYLLDQYTDILVHYPRFRESLRVILNDTVESLPGANYRFLRAGYWDCDREILEMRHHKPALVNVRLAGPLIAWLIGETAKISHTYSQLLELAQLSFPEDEPADLRGTLDKLLEIGFLRFIWPWPSDDLHLEKRILRELGEFLPDDRLESFLNILRRSIGILESYNRTPAPAATVAEAKRMIAGLVPILAPLGGLDPKVRIKGEFGHYFEENVFLVSGSSEALSGEVVRLSLHKAQEILRDVDPLTRISNLDSSRHDFLHTLAVFASERWPDQDQVSFLEVFDTSHALFQSWVKADVAARAYGPLRAPAFNPFNLERIERLGDWRQRIADGMENCFEPDGDERRLDRDAITRLLDQVPSPYADSRDFCAFIQPLDDIGNLWVLNTLFEGAGRLSSRYTPVMDRRMREEWTAFFRKLSVFQQGDETVELVDLFCPAGHTLNVHAPQTERVLEIPGESSGLPPERRLRLSELKLRLLGPDRYPQLVDASSRRILPLHLGGLVFRYMPNLLKFLMMFGPGEFRFCIPCKRSVRVGDLDVVERHRVGNLIFRRKSWTFEVPPLRDSITGLKDATAFLAINQWRLERSLPERVFLIEPFAEGPTKRAQRKPQYIDFTSPGFVEIFRSAIDMDVPKLSILEALPKPGEFPLGVDGKRWGVELQLDCFGFPSWTQSLSPSARACT